jgi:ribonuclease HI
MSDTAEWIIHTDGAARGNPGPAALAYVIERPGQGDIEFRECLGTATNNVAEYTALVRALERARELGGRRLRVHSDSELLVQQMNGNYKVKHPGLRPLYDEAQELCRGFERVTFQHVRREDNARADRLCNEALDGPRETRAPSATRKVERKTSSPRREQVREEALECLRGMAAAWARGNPHDPKPEDVWDQLWTILEDGGVLRT